MNTPVFDFVKAYEMQGLLRLHMPGHKGIDFTGNEARDITEVFGADTLYSEESILAESQRNASYLFGTAMTLYSAQGSTLSIHAMLSLFKVYAASLNRKPVLLATRNAHRAFLCGCALMDLDPIWIHPGENDSLLSSVLTPSRLEEELSRMKEPPLGLYLTSPDYLGNLSDIAGLSRICRKKSILLMVDNAHGAYLHFLPESQHPIALGADICCDSAHKTLPVLTGGGYLHISRNAPAILCKEARRSIGLFASSSPSYLILASLDRANRELSETFPSQLTRHAEIVFALKKEFQRAGLALVGKEPMKISLAPKVYGYRGDELAQMLRQSGIEAEFSDPDFLVLMPSPYLESGWEKKLSRAILSTVARKPVLTFPPKIVRGEKACSVRQAMLSPSRRCPVEEAVGKVLASPSVHCPPAIPIAICGEVLTTDSIALFEYYGIDTVSVLDE